MRRRNTMDKMKASLQQFVEKVKKMFAKKT